MQLDLTREQLMERGGSLDATLDGLPQPAILVDREASVIYANRQAVSRWSREPRSDRGIQSEDSRQVVLHTLRTGKAQVGTLEIIQGERVLSNVVPIVDGGDVIGALCMVVFQNLAMVKDAVARISTSREADAYYDKLARMTSRYTFSDFIGETPQALEVVRQCRLASQSQHAILITGETGCGKEILAGAIHAENTQRSTLPFVKINCTAIPKDLLEAELFGYEKGAFTGALSTKPGKFELAENGTLLLDEIGDMDPALQAKLLRVLEEREFERVGGLKLYPLRARVIATTNRDLRQMAEEGRFRADLYYRLGTIEIHVPPLRDRRADIPLLADHFVARSEAELTLAQGAYAAMMTYTWPGNVRQLKNLIDRLAAMYSDAPVTGERVRQALGPALSPADSGCQTPPQPGQTLAQVERVHIQATVERCRYNIAQAARELGISRSTLYEKWRRYGLDLTGAENGPGS